MLTTVFNIIAISFRYFEGLSYRTALSHRPEKSHMTIIQEKKERCRTNLRQAVRQTGGQTEVLS